MRVCSNSPKPLCQLKPNSMWHQHGIGEKMKAFSNDLGLCCNSLLSIPVGGAFSRDFTTNSALQCRALQIQKLKAPLFPRGRGIQMTGALLKMMHKVYKVC